MARITYVQHPVTHELIPKDQYVRPSPGGVTVISDHADFVSPIDGKVVSGRAQLREHCKVHDVIPTADLAGMPNQLQSAPDREGVREALKRAVYK
jgi:hypothetical protein